MTDMGRSSFLTRRRCVGGLGLLAVAGYLAPALAKSGIVRQSRYLLGTQIDIVAQGLAAQQAIDSAFVEMQRLEGLMSRYRADSELSALQDAAGRQWRHVAPETLAVLRQALALSRESHGVFDVTVGAYDGWSFAPEQPRLPSEHELQEQRHLVGYRSLQLDEGSGQARLMKPGMKLDLGGVAKLPILSAGMRVLKQYGLDGAMINGGGDVLVSGQLDGRDWRIGLRDPASPSRLMASVTLRDGIVASSGDYERSFLRNGQRYHHVLDPSTGLPVSGVRGVAMVARDMDAVNGRGAMAMLLGPDQAKPMLARLPGVDSLLVDQQGRRWYSPGMPARLDTGHAT